MFKRIHNAVWQICCRSVFRQFVKYGITGAGSVVIDTGLLFILTEYLGLWYMLSAIISQSVSVIFNFLMNRKWSFGSNGFVRRQMVRYSLLLVFNYLYQLGALWFFVEALHFHYLLAKIFISMIMVSWNFLMFKYVVYK